MKEVHLICNSHIDPMWLWRWEEGCAAALSTFRTVVKLMDEYPELVFNHNESLLYEWAAEYDPELFARIQTFVAEGRWHIMGGWYLQPDCNLPTGEALVRNILEGRRFFRKHFGKRPSVAVNFDSFGHTRGLVQVLKKAGYEGYIICRPDKTHYPFPQQDFVWRGLDGSEIAVHRSDENYNSVFGHAAEELEAFLKEKANESVTLFLWGVGDHGGGPSRIDLEQLRKLSEKRRHDLLLTHSSAESYFHHLHVLETRFPVLERGLNPVSEGCYTSQIRVKQAYRRLENELFATEKMCAQAAFVFGSAYPKQRLHQAQRALLLAQFHDALPGSGTQLVEEDTLRGLNHGLEIVAQERFKAFLALAKHQPPAQPDTVCVLVYNPHPFAISGPLAVETELPKQNWDDTFMYPHASMNGVAVPTQAEMEESNFRIDWRKKICVDVTLPPASMSRIDVAFEALQCPDRPPCPEISQNVNYIFDNGRLHVEIDPHSGMLCKYSVDGMDLLGKNGMALVVREDIYNSWGLQDNAHEPGKAFTLLSAKEGTRFSGLHDRIIPSVRVIEDGEVRTVIEAVLGHERSRAVVRYALPKRGVKVDVDVSVWWCEKDRYLKLELDCFRGVKHFMGQVAFGRDTLAKHHEAVSQKWLSVNNERVALAVLNDGCYGSSLNADVLGVTLLRSAGYAASDCNGKLALREARYINRMEQGERHFHLALFGGKAQTVTREVDREALAFNERPFALNYNPCGDGKALLPCVTIDAQNVQLSCLKQAEDGDGWIVRLYESCGEYITATVALPAWQLEQAIAFMPFEIKTYRLNKCGFHACELLEGY